MARKHTRTTVVSFKVEAELAELLNGLPNKSAFIRKAIAAQLGVACPLCLGQGIVSRGLHQHFAQVVSDSQRRQCAACGTKCYAEDPGALEPKDRARLEQFFLGGPLYCEGCYRTAPPCGECGWHFDGDKIGDHMRSAHSGEDET